MHIIVGLGNPTKEYEETRHNIGFSVIDALADRFRIDVTERKHKALCGKGIIGGERVILTKPQTFMNLSGESVRAIADFYKIPPEDVIVIFDDVSLDVGQLRIRLKGSAGGHNGIKSIINHLGTQEFPRIKVGVGEKPKEMDLANYVLGCFSKGEKEQMETTRKEASEAVYQMLNGDMEAAMNQFNAKKKSEKKPIAEETQHE